MEKADSRILSIFRVTPLTSTSRPSCSLLCEVGTGDVVRELEQELGRELGLELDLEFGLEMSCDVFPVFPDCGVSLTDRRLEETGLGVLTGLGVSFLVIFASGAKIPYTKCEKAIYDFCRFVQCLTNKVLNILRIYTATSG